MALWSRKKDGEAPAAAVPPPVAPPVAASAVEAPAPVAPPQPAAAAVAAPAPGAEPQLSPEEAQKRAAVSKQLLMSFGEIVSVLMRSPQFRTMPLSEIEALVVPAILSGQFLVAEAQSKSKGFVTPVAIALWASVSAEVDQRLSSDLEKPFRLQANEWRSGDIAWLVTIAGDGRIISPMLKQLQETTLKGKPLKMRVRGKDGKVTVGTFTGQTQETSTTPMA